MPEISAIVPVYNCSQYLERSIRSILAQTFTDFELILVDDGSADGSGELCDRLAAEDSRIKVVHKENGGAGSARNAGMDIALAPFWVFPDSDDWMEPDMFEVLHKHMVETGADVAICGFTSNYDYEKPEHGEKTFPKAGFLSNLQDVRDFFVDYFPDGMAGYLWNKMYKADVIKNNNIRFTDMRRYQDGMFNLELFDHVSSAVLIDSCLYHYKLNDVQDVFVKYPVNKFELLSMLLTEYELQLSKWGLNKPQQMEKICSFFLRGVVSCIDSMYSPWWNFNGEQRKLYLKELADDIKVNEMLKIRKIYGRYPDLILSLLEKKHYLLIRLVVRSKIFLKKNCKSVFLTLKRWGIKS
jgi:glycosyltransferase involved in cell wall biosynthesis